MNGDWDKTIENLRNSQRQRKAKMQAGMTLREYYAGLAMQALAAREVWDPTDLCAKIAVQYADSLIAELAKTQPESTK